MTRFTPDPEFAEKQTSNGEEKRIITFPKPGDPNFVLYTSSRKDEPSQSPPVPSTSNQTDRAPDSFPMSHIPHRRDVLATSAYALSNIPPWIFNKHDLVSFLPVQMLVYSKRVIPNCASIIVICGRPNSSQAIPMD